MSIRFYLNVAMVDIGNLDIGCFPRFFMYVILK